MGLPAVDATSVYVGEGEDLVRLSRDGGAGVARYPLSAPLLGQPTVTDDIVLGATTASVTLFGKASGEVVQVLDAGGELALGNGLLVAAGGSGGITAWWWRVPTPE